jgi:hypothetical protein
MSNAISRDNQQCLANLDALHRQLKEMVVRTKEPDGMEREQHQKSSGPVLVIRGK